MSHADPYFAHPSACIDLPCDIGAGSKIWHFCHISSGCKIGTDCHLGQNVYVANGAVLGNHVKVQNNVSIYAGVLLDDDVFLGPSCVFTNIQNPRAEISRQSFYETTHLRRGCTIGANATVVCGTHVGRYAFVAAGAVLTHSIPDYAFVLGVPARQAGWISRHGHRLRQTNADGMLVCPESGLRYREQSQAAGLLQLTCIDVPEDDPLSAPLRQGQRPYSAYRHPEPT